MHVTNNSINVVRQLRLRISEGSTSSDMPFNAEQGPSAQVYVVEDLQPGESRDVVYRIRREYYLDTDALLASGQRLRRDYGYVEDGNPFAPKHDIAITGAAIIIDGEPPA
jgi:hypothetical protein